MCAPYKATIATISKTRACWKNCKRFHPLFLEFCLIRQHAKNHLMAQYFQKVVSCFTSRSYVDAIFWKNVAFFIWRRLWIRRHIWRYDFTRYDVSNRWFRFYRHEVGKPKCVLLRPLRSLTAKTFSELSFYSTCTSIFFQYVHRDLPVNDLLFTDDHRYLIKPKKHRFLALVLEYVERLLLMNVSIKFELLVIALEQLKSLSLKYKSERIQPFILS